MDDFEAGTPPAEGERLGALVDRLVRERPTPSPSFRGVLSQQLRADVEGEKGPLAIERSRWPMLVATYSILGALLLAVSALGLAGIGPFGA